MSSTSAPHFNFTTYQQEVLGTGFEMKITLSIKALSGRLSSALYQTSHFVHTVIRFLNTRALYQRLSLQKSYASSFEFSHRDLCLFQAIPSADLCLNPISPGSTSSPRLSSDDPTPSGTEDLGLELFEDNDTSMSKPSSSSIPRADCMMSSICAEMTLRSVGGWVRRRAGVGSLLEAVWGVDRGWLRGRWCVGRRTPMSCSSAEGVSGGWADGGKQDRGFMRED